MQRPGVLWLMFSRQWEVWAVGRRHGAGMPALTVSSRKTEYVESVRVTEGAPWEQQYLFLESVIKTIHLSLEKYSCTQNAACALRDGTDHTGSQGLRIPIWRTAEGKVGSKNY